MLFNCQKDLFGGRMVMNAAQVIEDGSALLGEVIPFGRELTSQLLCVGALFNRHLFTLCGR